MIAFPQPIADAYTSPSRNVSLPSTPGRTVRFLQGHAVLKDGRDLVALLRRSDVKLVMTPYSMSWFEEWLKQVPDDKIKAEIVIPDDKPVHQGWEPPDGADGARADQGA